MSDRAFKIVAWLSMATVLLWPLMLARGSRLGQGTPQVLLWAMPLFVVASAVLAMRSHGERPHVAWVLLAMLWLSVLAILLLVSAVPLAG